MKRLLQLDPTRADVYNARGEVRRKSGSFPKALADFGAAIKLKPDYAAARANYKSLAYEIERIGALIAVAGKPSFHCKTARRAVEKAICANRELADLDREIHAMLSGSSAMPGVLMTPASCSASRRRLSPAAMPSSAGRATICARP